MLGKVLTVCVLISLTGVTDASEAKMAQLKGPPHQVKKRILNRPGQLRPRKTEITQDSEKIPELSSKNLLSQMEREMFNEEREMFRMRAEAFDDEKEMVKAEEEMYNNEKEMFRNQCESFLRNEKTLRSDDDGKAKRASKLPEKSFNRIYKAGDLLYRKIAVTLYNRHEIPVFGTGANLPPMTLNKDTVFLVHGVRRKQAKYLQDFFNTTVEALLSEKDYNVVALNWTEMIENEESSKAIEHNIGAAGIVGEAMGRIINAIRQKNPGNHVVYAIGHDLGTVAIERASKIVKKPIEFIYGINQRYYKNNRYGLHYLREDMGNVVQTLTTNGFPFSLTHRDIYPNDGKFILSADRSYKLLADVIRAKGVNFVSTFCSSFKDYVADKCKNFPSVSLWNNYSTTEKPVGRYYLRLIAMKSSKKKE